LHLQALRTLEVWCWREIVCDEGCPCQCFALYQFRYHPVGTGDPSKSGTAKWGQLYWRSPKQFSFPLWAARTE